MVLRLSQVSFSGLLRGGEPFYKELQHCISKDGLTSQSNVTLSTKARNQQSLKQESVCLFLFILQNAPRVSDSMLQRQARAPAEAIWKVSP